MTMTYEATLEFKAAVAHASAVAESEAGAAEADGHITELTIETFHHDDLFRSIMPTALGGREIELLAAFDLIEEMSRADGSAGWTLMAGATTLAIIGAFLSDEAVAEIFSDVRAVSAGQAAPLGTAVEVPGGYRAQGTFGFASGSRHATWMLGGFREQLDGAPVRLESGLPNVLVGVVPRSNVELLGNWEVIGLVATDSVDYSIAEQLIPAAFTFPLFTGMPQRGGPHFKVGVNGLTCVGHAAFACGVARRALDEMAAHASSKRRPGRKTLIDDGVFQYEYGRAEAGLNAARFGARAAIDALAQRAARDVSTPRDRAMARLATNYACTAATQAVRTAYEFSGSHGLRNGSALQRCFRNISAAEQHVFTNHSVWGDAAQALLGIDTPTLVL